MVTDVVGGCMCACVCVRVCASVRVCVCVCANRRIHPAYRHTYVGWWADTEKECDEFL